MISLRPDAQGNISIVPSDTGITLCPLSAPFSKVASLGLFYPHGVFTSLSMFQLLNILSRELAVVIKLLLVANSSLPTSNKYLALLPVIMSRGFCFSGGCR